MCIGKNNNNIYIYIYVFKNKFVDVRLEKIHNWLIWHSNE